MEVEIHFQDKRLNTLFEDNLSVSLMTEKLQL